MFVLFCESHVRTVESIDFGTGPRAQSAHRGSYVTLDFQNWLSIETFQCEGALSPVHTGNMSDATRRTIFSMKLNVVSTLLPFLAVSGHCFMIKFLIYTA